MSPSSSSACSAQEGYTMMNNPLQPHIMQQKTPHNQSNNNNKLNNTDEPQLSSADRWKRIRLRLVAMSKFKSLSAEVIASLSQIYQSPNHTNLHNDPHNTDPHNININNDILGSNNNLLHTDNPNNNIKNEFNEAIDDHRRRAQQFHAVAIGDVQQWIKLYRQDPKSTIFDSSSAASPINAFNRFGLTFLHVAAQNGDVAMISNLLDFGALPNIKSKHPDIISSKVPSETPLQVAIRWRHAEATAVLLQRGKYPINEVKRLFKYSDTSKAVRDTLRSYLKLNKSASPAGFLSSCCGSSTNNSRSSKKNNNIKNKLHE